MHSQVKASTRLRGRPPYGYVLTITKEETPVLIPDGDTADVVRRIFNDYRAGRGLQAIAESLNREGKQSPSARRSAVSLSEGHGSAWSKGGVRSILVNPRYAGLPAPSTAVSDRIVAPEVFFEVQERLTERSTRRASEGEAAQRVYALKGLVRCIKCNRLMQGSWNNDSPYYRCRYPATYAELNGIDHPRNVYLRESRVIDRMHGWLGAILRRADETLGGPAAGPVARPAARPGTGPGMERRAASGVHWPEVLAEYRRCDGDLARMTAGSRAGLYRALGLRMRFDATADVVEVRVGPQPGPPIDRAVLAL